ncbi:TRAP transporter large permease subunit [Chloroflexota bacterium]
MDWYLALFLIFGSLILLMVVGIPVAFAFIIVNTILVFVFLGGEVGIHQFILSMRSSITSFTLVPLPLFILMGEVMFISGIGPRMMDAIDNWIGRLPGRLSLEAVGGGALFATLTGASVGSVAMLGSVLIPKMEAQGYKKSMSLGPILGSGGLAIMIPPSALAVFLGTVGDISIGKLLIAIVFPGLLMALLYASYIITTCRIKPHLAPPYSVTLPPISKRLIDSIKYILPLGIIVFLVVGVIFLGIATPSEAAATGTLGCFVLSAAYGKLKWEVVKNATAAALRITIMIFVIILGAKAYSQILAYTGATNGMVQWTAGLPLNPLLIIIAMQIVLIILGMFINAGPVMMITLPIFMPIVRTFGFDEVWFGVIVLLNMEMAQTTPPFGLSLFVMKGVAPPDTTMGEVYRAALPYLYCDVIAMVLIFAFPQIALWLPSIMR